MRAIFFLVVLMQICCWLISAAELPASNKLELSREMIVQLSSIRMLTRSLPNHSKCQQYANKLQEFGGATPEDGSSHFGAAIESLSGGKTQSGQFLLDDLKMCLILLGSGGKATPETESSPASVVIVAPEEKQQVISGERAEEFVALRRELDETKLELGEAKRVLVDVKGLLETSQREIDESKRTASADRELIADLRRQLEEEKKASAELGNDLNAKQAKINSMLEAKSRQNCDQVEQKWSTKVAESLDQINELQHKLRSLKESSERELNRKVATIKELSDSLKSSEARVNKLDAELGDLKRNNELFGYNAPQKFKPEDPWSSLGHHQHGPNCPHHNHNHNHNHFHDHGHDHGHDHQHDQAVNDNANANEVNDYDILRAHLNQMNQFQQMPPMMMGGPFYAQW